MTRRLQGCATVLRLPAQQTSCVTADSPHSGRRYPADFIHACSRNTLRQAEDAYLDRLLSFLPDLGIPLLLARFPRSYIDANRSPDSPSLIRRHVRPHYPIAIFEGDISLSTLFNRLRLCYAPYHRALDQLLSQTQARTGRVIHLNWHSMPAQRIDATDNPYDIIIGTRRGKTAAPELAEHLATLFRAHGYRVGIDISGFVGGEIVRRAGRPRNNRHALQIEINRALYLDEARVRLDHAKTTRLQADLRQIVTAFQRTCDNPGFSVKPAPCLRKPQG